MDEEKKGPSIALMVAKKMKRGDGEGECAGDDDSGIDFDEMADDLIKAVQGNDKRLVASILRAVRQG